MNDTRNEYKINKIKQIIPADGWHMKYQLKGQEIKTNVLSCWALCETEATGEDVVVGMITSPLGVCIECNTLEGFIDYAYEPSQ